MRRFERQIHELVGNIQGRGCARGPAVLFCSRPFGGHGALRHEDRSRNLSQNKKLNKTTLLGNLKLSNARSKM
jgi:hypothetical protein